jgi:Tripartite ATP-independent periplasmic transporter, DctM component
MAGLVPAISWQGAASKGRDNLGHDGVRATRTVNRFGRKLSPAGRATAARHPSSAIVLFGSLLFPVAKAMGVHYALVIILTMGIGLFAPPFDVGFYGACAIGHVSPNYTLWRVWPNLAALTAALAIVAAVPHWVIQPDGINASPFRHRSLIAS